MKTNRYVKIFASYEKAYNWLQMKKQSSVKDHYALVDGPENNFAVVDLMTAIELGCGYTF